MITVKTWTLLDVIGYAGWPAERYDFTGTVEGFAADLAARTGITLANLSVKTDLGSDWAVLRAYLPNGKHARVAAAVPSRQE